MLTVTRRPPDATVMLRRAKARMYVERQSHGLGGAVPPRDLGDNELQFVEQPGAHRGVARPRLLLVVTQKIPNLEMLADWKIYIPLRDLQKALGRGLVSA